MLLTPTQISADLAGKYQVESLLGQGMAQTWQAKNAEGVPVVIKAICLGEQENWAGYQAFETEISGLQRIQHTAIPAFLDFFKFEGSPSTRLYLVMSQLPGISLQAHLNAGKRFASDEILQIATETLGILQVLHGLNPPLIHRDIKPANLLWDGKQLSLVDFGSVTDLMTPQSELNGTYGFMAPEVFLGHVSQASDLYALGAVLCQLLTGLPPAELLTENLVFQLDLPQDRFLQSWLESLTHSNLLLRFSDASSALKALNNRHEWVLRQALLKKIGQMPPLTDSPLRVETVGESLTINIPSGYTLRRRNSLLSMVLLLLALYFFPFGFPPAWPLTLLLSLIAFLACLKCVFSLTATRSLELNPESYLWHEHALFVKLQKTGKANEFTRMEWGQMNLLEHPPHGILRIKRKGKSDLTLPGYLFLAEQEWLRFHLFRFAAQNLPLAQATRLIDDSPALEASAEYKRMFQLFQLNK